MVQVTDLGLEATDLEVPAIGTARALQDEGAIVLVLDHTDRSAQAQMANDFDAEL